MVIALVVFALLAIALLGLLLRRVAVAYLKGRGTRVVTCPENEEPAAVKLSEWFFAWTAIFGPPRLRLRDCSRWREYGPCPQACLPRIEAAPEDCLVRRMLAKWYQGKSCTCCGKSLDEIRWGTHKPCLMSPELKILEWNDIQPERIPRVLETHQPVCRSCFVAEVHTW